MIVVDSSVWIDYFNGVGNSQTEALDSMLGREPVAAGDLIVMEVLQGFRSDPDFDAAKGLFQSLIVFEMLNESLAIKSAQNYRALRRLGLTVHKSADTIIATFCIESGHSLLFSDRDFEPFVEHRGLLSVLSF